MVGDAPVLEPFGGRSGLLLEAVADSAEVLDVAGAFSAGVGARMGATVVIINHCVLDNSPCMIWLDRRFVVM